MRYAVLDTNILVSALMRPDGPPGRAMAAVKRGELVPVFSQDILAEYGTVLQRPHLRLDTAKVSAALDQILAVGILVPGTAGPPPPGLPDVTDWPFISCALVAGCPVVTGNSKDFPSKLGVRVMTAREWVGTLGNE